MYSSSDIEKLNIAADRFTYWLDRELNTRNDCTRSLEFRLYRYNLTVTDTFAVVEKPIRDLKQVQATNLVETLFSALYKPFEDLDDAAKQQFALLDQDKLLEELASEFEFYTKHKLDELTAFDAARIANVFLAAGIYLPGENETLNYIAFGE